MCVYDSLKEFGEGVWCRILSFSTNTKLTQEEETWDDQGRDGGTNFILRIKEQDNMPNPSGTWWWWWYKTYATV